MNAGRLIIAQLLRKPLQTVLAVVLLALGIATLVFVVLVQGQLSRQLTRDAQGIDLVVGAKGSPLQLILSAVYHIDIPTGNVPLGALEHQRQPAGCQVIPVSLGDNFRGFRIVGTEPELIEHYGGRLLPARSGPRRCKRCSAPKSLRHRTLDRIDVFRSAWPDRGRSRARGVHLQRGRRLDADRDGSRSACDHRQSERLARARRRTCERRRARNFGEREVTALLVRYASPLAAAIVPRQVNAESRLMAASPASELAAFRGCRRWHKHNARVRRRSDCIVPARPVCHVV